MTDKQKLAEARGNLALYWGCTDDTSRGATVRIAQKLLRSMQLAETEESKCGMVGLLRAREGTKYARGSDSHIEQLYATIDRLEEQVRRISKQCEENGHSAGLKRLEIDRLGAENAELRDQVANFEMMSGEEWKLRGSKAPGECQGCRGRLLVINSVGEMLLRWRRIICELQAEIRDLKRALTAEEAEDGEG